jgi:hypothetical protein
MSSQPDKLPSFFALQLRIFLDVEVLNFVYVALLDWDHPRYLFVVGGRSRYHFFGILLVLF